MGTKKIAALVFLAVVFSTNAFSQNIGIALNADGSAPASSAILDVSSSNKGFLPPRMTYAQKIAIASPIAGLMVYCTNCGTVGELQVFNGIAWTSVIGNVASAAKPDAPTIGTATAGSAKAMVAFTAPASNGGSTITSYTATSSPGAITGTLSQAGSGTITVNGLTNGTAYTFTVTATTVAGTGPASAVSNSVKPIDFPPGAPTIGTATAGNAQATVAFTAPVSNGSSAITSYTATSSPGSKTGTLSQAGSGTITVTGLTNGTAYTFTVKATNAAGTGAASAASNSITPVVPTLTDGSGNTYELVTIGTQTWMAKNLSATKYSDGTAISNVTNNISWTELTTEAYCDYNNRASNSVTYGRLYNWYAVNTGKLCPSGSHVPSDAEWTKLITYLGGEAGAGGKLKETGTSHWQTPNTGATNSSSFTALPSGFRHDTGNFEWMRGGTIWWSSTAASTTNAWIRTAIFEESFVKRYNLYSKRYGLSVRCLKD